MLESVYIDGTGDIWIGTEDGFARFDGQTLTHYLIDNPDVSWISVRKTVTDSQDVLQLNINLYKEDRSREDFVARYDRTDLVFIPVNEMMEYGPSDFTIAPDGTVWLVGDGIVSFMPPD